MIRIVESWPNFFFLRPLTKLLSDHPLIQADISAKSEEWARQTNQNHNALRYSYCQHGIKTY